MPDVLDVLRAQGQVDSTGSFTLDRDRAMEKMRQFQLPEPRLYVLHLVQAAVALGATSIDVRATPRVLTMTVTGVTLPEELVVQPLVGLFVDPQTLELAGCRHLGIALNAALALKPASIELTSGKSVNRLTLADMHVAPAIETLFGFRVTVHSGKGWRPPWSTRGLFELLALRVRASTSPIPLTLNGERVDDDVPHSVASYSRGRIRMWLGQQPGIVVFVRHGVQVCHRTLQLKAPAANAMVRADDLLINLSGTDVVEDERYTRVLSELDQACDGWLNLVCDEFLTADVAHRVLLRTPLLQALSSQTPTPRLLTVPVFETVRGHWLSPRQLREHADPHQRLLYWPGEQTPPDTWLGDGVVVRVREPGEQTALQALFGRTLQVPSWQLKPGPPAHKKFARALTLSEGDYLIIVPLDDPSFHGELGLLRNPGSEVRITFFKKGRLVDQRLWQDQPVAFRMKVNHDRFELNVFIDGVVEDDLYRSALRMAGRHVTEACVQLAQNTSSLPIRHVLSAWLQGKVGQLDSVPPAIRNYPLFPTVRGAVATLADLQADQKTYGTVFYTTDLAPGYQADQRHIVSDKAAVQVVRRLFRSTIDYTEALKQERSGVAGLPTRADLGPCLVAVAFHTDDANGVIGIGRGPLSSVRILSAGRPHATRAVEPEFGAVEAIIDIPGRPDQYQVALRSGGDALAAEVARTWRLPPPPAQRAWLLRYLHYRCPDIGDDLLDVPLFEGLNESVLSIRQLQAQTRLRWVSEDTRPGPLDAVVLVGTVEEATGAARLAGLQGTENYEHALQEQKALQLYVTRAPCSTSVDHACHLVEVSHGRIGFLQPTLEFEGCSTLRVVYRERLLVSVSIPTPVPLDLVTWDPGLRPSSGYRSVERDALYRQVVDRLLGAIEIGLDTIHAQGASPDTCLLWALSAADGPAALVQASPASLLGRILDAPTLEDSESRPMTLREVARQVMARDRCCWVAPQTAGRAADPALRLVRLAPLQHQWMGQAFRVMHDYTAALTHATGPTRRLASSTLQIPTSCSVKLENWGEIGISADGTSGIQIADEGMARPLFGDLPVVGVVRTRDDRQAALEDALDTLYAEVDDLKLLIPYFRYRHERLDRVAAARRPAFATNRGERLSLDAVLRFPGTVWYSLLHVESSLPVLELDAPTRDFLSDLLGDRLQRARVHPRIVVQGPARPITPPPLGQSSLWSRLLAQMGRLRRLLFRPAAAHATAALKVVDDLRTVLTSSGLQAAVVAVEHGELLRFDGRTVEVNCSHRLMRRLASQPDAGLLLAACIRAPSGLLLSVARAVQGGSAEVSK